MTGHMLFSYLIVSHTTYLDLLNLLPKLAILGTGAVTKHCPYNQFCTQMAQVTFFWKPNLHFTLVIRTRADLTKCIMYPTKHPQPYNSFWLLNVPLILEAQHRHRDELGSCFGRGVGPDDLSRSLPTPVILWIHAEWVKLHCLHIPSTRNSSLRYFWNPTKKCLFWLIFEMKHNLPAPSWPRSCDKEHVPSGSVHRDFCPLRNPRSLLFMQGKINCVLNAKLILREVQLVAAAFSYAFSSPKAADSELHMLVSVLCSEDLYSHSAAKPIFSLSYIQSVWEALSHGV